MIDSYQKFIDGLGINYEDFIQWGIDNTIYPTEDKIDIFWEQLKTRINAGDEVYIRSYGREGKGNDIILDFYSMFGIKVKNDPSNNMKPTKNLQYLTGMTKYSSGVKNPSICNYQVSHIFGKTKNVYMFESPWNVCFVPKIFDPLTGHEAYGKFPDDYKKQWVGQIAKKLKKYIDEYNTIVKDFDIKTKISKFLSDVNVVNKYSDKQRKRFERDMIEEFSLL